MAFDKVRDVKLFADDGSGYPLEITGTEDGTKKRLDVALGLAVQAGWNIPPYDKIVATYPTTTKEVFVYSIGGVNHTTLTVEYTDATKQFFTSAVKT